jgi:monofunctional biosynthetic peptidoglycan transglycosylase
MTTTRRKRRARGRHPRLRPLRWLLAAALIFVLFSLALVVPLRWLDPPTSAFMLRDRLAGVAVEQAWVDYEDIGPSLPIAVVASEDQKFPLHHGFDLDAIRDAVAGGASRGASTISQQVAKNLYLWPGRSWLRKGLEAWLTLLIEATWPKRRILEVYLNIAQFGPGLYGAWAASLHYYDRPPDLISLREAARLAAVLPSPARMDPAGDSAYLAGRAAWIVGQVRGLGGPAYLAALEEP